MLTRQATQCKHAHQQKEAHEAELALQWKLDKRLKHQQAKQQRYEECTKEEEQCKQIEDKQRRAKETAEEEAALAQLVSLNVEMAKSVHTTSLLSIMNGNIEEEVGDENLENWSPASQD